MTATDAAEDESSALTRLRRVKGHVRGIVRMVERAADPVEVLEQLNAVTKALRAVAADVADGHLSQSIGAALASGEPVVAERLLAESRRTIERLSKC